MVGILQDTSEQGLIEAIETHWSGIFRLLRHWWRAEVHDRPDMLWVATDIAFPT